MHSRGVLRSAWPLCLLVLSAVLASCGPRPEPPATPPVAPDAPTEPGPPGAEAPPTNAPAPAQPETADVPQEIRELEEQVRSRINAVRQERGLQPLEPHEELRQVARDYSRLMAQKDFFSHTAPSGETAVGRIRDAGIQFRLVGENIFKSVNVSQERVAQVAVQGWMDSPGHRENILREGFTHTGVGITRRNDTYYFTQLFLTPR